MGFLAVPSPLLQHSVFYTPTSVTALTSDQLEVHSTSMDFFPGQDTAIIDNCANTHIWNKRDHLLTFREFHAKEQVMSTIGGKQHYPLCVSDVAVSWRDDNHKISFVTRCGMFYIFPILLSVLLVHIRWLVNGGIWLMKRELTSKSSIPTMFVSIQPVKSLWWIKAFLQSIFTQSAHEFRF